MPQVRRSVFRPGLGFIPVRKGRVEIIALHGGYGILTAEEVALTKYGVANRLERQGFLIDLDATNDPVNVRGFVEMLPFKYLAYFPAAVFLGKIQGPEMYTGLAIELAWVVFFIVLARILWWRGVNRYSGFGG